MPLQNTYAVWKGSPVLEEKRAVPLLFFNTDLYCSSAWLYSSRIVFTAAHVVFNGDDRRNEYTIPRSKVWIGYPGSIIEPKMKLVESEKIFTPSNFKGRDAWRGGKTITRQNDFAVIVLKEPIPTDDKPVELLTPELHDSLIAKNENVDLVGYGKQSPEDFDYCYKRAPMKYSSQITSKIIQTGQMIFTSTLNTKVGPMEPNGCDGDSGSGFVKVLPDKYIYLGAMGAGSWMNHNCNTWDDAKSETSINGSDPVYLFLDLIKQAEDYVKANPYVAPVIKKSIKCVKEKKVISVRNEFPKCPKGYKQK